MSVPVMSVATTVVADLAIAELVAGACETAFPPLDEEKPLYITALEATGQAVVSTILALEIRSNLAGIYKEDPTGGFISVPATLYLQKHLLTKLDYVQKRLLDSVRNYST